MIKCWDYLKWKVRSKTHLYSFFLCPRILDVPLLSLLISNQASSEWGIREGPLTGYHTPWPSCSWCGYPPRTPFHEHIRSGVPWPVTSRCVPPPPHITGLTGLFQVSMALDYPGSPQGAHLLLSHRDKQVRGLHSSQERLSINWVVWHRRSNYSQGTEAPASSADRYYVRSHTCVFTGFLSNHYSVFIT